MVDKIKLKLVEKRLDDANRLLREQRSKKGVKPGKKPLTSTVYYINPKIENESKDYVSVLTKSLSDPKITVDLMGPFLDESLEKLDELSGDLLSIIRGNEAHTKNPALFTHLTNSYAALITFYRLLYNANLIL